MSTEKKLEGAALEEAVDRAIAVYSSVGTQVMNLCIRVFVKFAGKEDDVSLDDETFRRMVENCEESSKTWLDKGDKEQAIGVLVLVLGELVRGSSGKKNIDKARELIRRMYEIDADIAARTIQTEKETLCIVYAGMALIAFVVLIIGLIIWWIVA